MDTSYTEPGPGHKEAAGVASVMESPSSIASVEPAAVYGDQLCHSVGADPQLGAGQQLQSSCDQSPHNSINQSPGQQLHPLTSHSPHHAATPISQQLHPLTSHSPHHAAT